MTAEQQKQGADESRRVTGTAKLGSVAIEFDVDDARPFSLRVHLREPVTIGRELEDVKITTGKQVHSLGRCRVEVDAERGKHRIAPIDELIHCRDVFKHGRFVRHAQSFDQLPLLWARKEAIHPEFAKYTASLVYDIQVYRERFDEIDAAIADESPELQEEIRASVISAQSPAFLAFFDERLTALENLVRNYSRAEHERHGYYFRRHVWPFITTSLFLNRTNVRPRGYAGDSMMMRYLYERAFVGDSIFGRLMHKHPIETAAAQAVRNRRRLIVETVESVFTASGRDELKLMSVACGPAWEVRDLYATPANCKRYVSTLLDQDEEALGEAEEEIGNASRRNGVDVRARYIQESVRTMLRTRDLPSVFGRHDFIYSMGLFDYLTAPVAKTVLAKLYEMVEPGGRLLVGNFHTRNPTRLYMEYWMDWVLLYRSDEDMLDLGKALPGAETSVFCEDTKSQVFLDVKKPRG
jgi:extracellular factor (EF) 3-hydroxypalmitic acid methyl ester biosynthesis protein